ncbi:MAG TPA: DinB family protein [Candidatus Sulfotelmatobacter sp.]|nr:DinB family protein [Candidatus Sulfotelmatobacter sp.]
MKTKWGIVVVLLLSLAGLAQNPKPKEEHRSVTMILDHTVGNLESEFVPAAEAMPEDKYGFAPTSGEFKNVRTYAQQIKHVAAVNYELGAAILEQKPPVDIGEESGPTSVTSKAEIIKYLKDSFEYAHKAIATINEGNLTGTVRSPFGEGWVSRLGLASSIASHGYDHYGQMVVYLRMNGIVPPASR